MLINDNLDLPDSEQIRMQKLFAYLLSKTNLGIDKRSLKTKGNKAIVPNESLVATQWGLSDYRILVRRILRSVLPEFYEHEKKEVEKVPSIDLSRLIKILSSLESYKSSNTSTYSDSNIQIKFTEKDKIKALSLYSELSKDERNTLNLPMDSNGKLVEQLLDRLGNAPKSDREKLLFTLYKLTVLSSTLIIYESDNTNKTSDKNNTSINNLEKINRIVKKILTDNLSIPSEILLNREIKIRTHKIVRELERILFQSGLRQISEIIKPQLVEIEIDQLSSDIISKLSMFLLENETVTQDLPIFIKWIDIKRVRPLPLRIYDSEHDKKGLINKKLIINNETTSIYHGDLALQQQVAYCVTVFFKINDEGIENKDEENFYEKVTGIGSPLSLATSAINKFLLWDLPCLQQKDIFPVPKEIFINSEIIGDAQATGAQCHNVVELCKCQDIQNAIDSKKNDVNKDVNVYGESAYGDFCSFDLLESVIKSRFMARLRAIKNLGIPLDVYLDQLKNKIKEQISLRKAKKYLKFYPFSRWAMEATLENELLKFYRNKTNSKLKLEFTENKKHSWSLIAYDAHLTLTEALLTEGKQIAAKYYLDYISNHISNPKNISSNLVRCRYYYLTAFYYYLYDLKDQNLYANKVKVIAEARKFIDEAKECLRKEVEMCHVIGGLSQTNSHPFFELFGKLYCLEARISLGFYDYVPKNESSFKSKSDNLKSTLIYLEKARICAAKDGNPDDYSTYSLFQSRIYFMIANLDDIAFLNSLNLDRDICKDWGDRLLNHAAICYIETGNESFNGLKFHAGITNKCDEFPKANKRESATIDEHTLITEISKIPFINELEQDYTDEERCYEDGSPILNIPFSSMFKKELELTDESILYLFGSQSCNFFLTYGMKELLDLCENDSKSSLEQIESILRHFIVAWAISKDGGNIEENEQEDKRTVVRKFEPPTSLDLPSRYRISSIRGLYPHRISQTVLSSTFLIILCEILRMIYVSQDKEKDYQAEVKDFKKVVSFFLSKEELYEVSEEINRSEVEGSNMMRITGQKRFNGHLDENIKNIKRYYEEIIEKLHLDDQDLSLSKSNQPLDFIYWRDMLLKSLLHYISGGSYNADLSK